VNAARPLRRGAVRTAPGHAPKAPVAARPNLTGKPRRCAERANNQPDCGPDAQLNERRIRLTDMMAELIMAGAIDRHAHTHG